VVMELLVTVHQDKVIEVVIQILQVQEMVAGPVAVVAEQVL